MSKEEFLKLCEAIYCINNSKIRFIKIDINAFIKIKKVYSFIKNNREIILNILNEKFELNVKRKTKKEKILEELNHAFPNLKFEFIGDRFYEFYLIYKDKSKEDDMLSDKYTTQQIIISIIKYYLDETELKDLSVRYDYHNEIIE